MTSAIRRSDQIIQRLRPKVAAVEGAKFFMQSGQDVTIGGRLSRTQYQYTLTDTDLAELNHWAPHPRSRDAKSCPSCEDVASDQQVAAPHIALEIDRDAASRLGISPSLIDATLYDAFGQRQVGDDVHLDQPVQGDPRGRAQIPDGSDGAVQNLCRRPERRADPAQRVRAFLRQARTVVGQPSGPIPGGDPVVQPRARRGARSRGRQDPGYRGRTAHRRRRSRARSRVRHRRSRPRCHRCRCWSRRRSLSSTSCSACSTRATSIRSPSSRPCPRPASARYWR